MKNMRDISECYRKLKEDRDIVEHGDMIDHEVTTGFYLNGYSLHFMKNNFEIRLKEKNKISSLAKVGEKVWNNHFFRRIKS